MDNNYGSEVKVILDDWGRHAEECGDKYLEFNVFGITDMSINAHELNVYLAAMKRQGGFQNRKLLRDIAITCARIESAYQRVERENSITTTKKSRKSTKNEDNT